MAIQIRDCIQWVSTAGSRDGVLWTHLEYPKVLLCEIPKIDPLIRFEVECELAAIPTSIVSAHVFTQKARQLLTTGTPHPRFASACLSELPSPGRSSTHHAHPSTCPSYDYSHQHESLLGRRRGGLTLGPLDLGKTLQISSLA